ncbi:MAG: hypothetical protein ABI275_02025 [Terrimesophilobacter sp.]
MPLPIEGRPDRTRASAPVHAALDAGVRFSDTADAHTPDADGPGHKKTLITVLNGRLVSVQNQFSSVHRESMPQLEYRRANGMAFSPWSTGFRRAAREPLRAGSLLAPEELGAGMD